LETDYVLILDVPGLPRNRLRVDLVDGDLRITASYPNDDAEGSSEGSSMQERRKRSFVRTSPVPEDAIVEAISAKLSRGELTVILPKKQPTVVEVPIIYSEDDEEVQVGEQDVPVPNDKPTATAAAAATAGVRAEEEAWVDLSQDDEGKSKEDKGKAPMESETELEPEVAAVIAEQLHEMAMNKAAMEEDSD
jgi:hypothetical protein